MYRLIHIEPDAAAHAAVLEILAESPLPFAVEQAPDPAAAVTTAGPGTVDAVLVRLAPRPDALAAIGRCRSGFPSQPLIVLTECADLAFARDALRAGAQDVVVRHARSLAVLSRIVLYAIERAGAEARRQQLQAAAATLAAVLDALLASSARSVLQTDAQGTIERLSPPAARLLDLALSPPSGTRLAALIEPQDAGRLRTFLAAAIPPPAAAFGFTVAGERRVIELQPLPLAVDGAPDLAPRLFELVELAADFAVDDAAAAPLPQPAPPHQVAKRQPCPAPTVRPAATVEAGGGLATLERPAAAGDEAAPASADRALALIEELRATASWRVVGSAGTPAGWGFLAADPQSTATLARLAVAVRDDLDVALAFDALQLRAWHRLAAAAPDRLPEHPALEVSYGTSASRPHLERYLADVAALPDGLGARARLVIGHVPRGIYVPTLAKTIRAVGSAHGKPALQLPELESDYRALVLGQLELLILDVADLKRALAKDGKAVAALLARAKKEGCGTLVRRAGGSLAEALRSRLGIDLTVDG